tara:strand:- start:309 stop:452 length:144 start_codon:yes stop_codon:yes gene_type:complete
MEFVILKKDRYKDRMVKVGQTDSITELKANGWTESTKSKPKKKKKKL